MDMQTKDLTQDETQRLFEIYTVWCRDRGLEPSVPGFIKWRDENYE